MDPPRAKCTPGSHGSSHGVSQKGSQNDPPGGGSLSSIHVMYSTIWTPEVQKGRELQNSL